MTNISTFCFQFHFVAIHRCLMWHTSRKKLSLRYNVALDKIFVTDGSMKTSEISVAPWKRYIPALGQSKQLDNFFSFKTGVSQGRAIGGGIKEVKRESKRKREHLFSLMLHFFSLLLFIPFSLDRNSRLQFAFIKGLKWSEPLKRVHKKLRQWLQVSF